MSEQLESMFELMREMVKADPADRVTVFRDALGVDDAYVAEHPEIVQSLAELDEAVATFNAVVGE